MFYEPVYFVDFHWLPDSPTKFPPLAWQISYWFSKFCFFSQKYENIYSSLNNDIGVIIK